ncbi:hypothetical protein [Phytoactinopolyspora halotolerans]|uniref:Uncharacterized protein n=1 Tax=Phytoactinopolyspora halotolerans TaxID=1981512 RepID=A0A6L9SGL6_9ACTN|nr:hypothetical protein [Phytoactinopolyspora halotolerans]NEE04283.1 hypothetical protein [Phytoactinopolyspora halotolerans]
MANAAEIMEDWPEQSREAAQLVIDKYGEPHEATDSVLIWHGVGPWKRMVASKTYYEHNFPAPHIDSVESTINYRVAPEQVSSLAQFDGSVVVERTAGEVTARCHDEEANFLALNLMHDIVTGHKNVTEAREYYAKEFLDVRRGERAPYMEGLNFEPGDASAADRDTRVLSDEQLERAQQS